jgi:signal transduction histidine kinase
VVACNNSGVRNEVGAVAEFVIEPTPYQTIWFRVLLFFGLLWTLYFLRVKRATPNVQDGLLAQVEERERIARELHDTLLQGFQGITRHAATFTLAVVGEPKVLESTAQDEPCRIASEALTNAFQHASASRIEVELTYDSSALHIRMRDDGVGINKAVLSNGQPAHWGLAGTRERAHALLC